MANIKLIIVGTSSYDITAKLTINKLSLTDCNGTTEWSFDGSSALSIKAITLTELNTLLNSM